MCLIKNIIPNYKKMKIKEEQKIYCPSLILYMIILLRATILGHLHLNYLMFQK